MSKNDITLDQLFSQYFVSFFLVAPAAKRGEEAEYKSWIKKFYRGTWLASGWVETTEQAVRQNGPEARQLMNSLGQRMCGEWAKPNDLRTVDSDDIKRWNRTAMNGLNDLQACLMEVESMLAGPLLPLVVYEKVIG